MLLGLNYCLLQGAESWIEATSCELEVYLDPERRVYSLLGLDY